jgi:hypothetical protein
MFTKTEPFGFPAHIGHGYRLNEKNFQVNPWDLRALANLRAIYRALAEPHDAATLFRLRPKIRKLQNMGARSILTHVIDQTEDPLMRILAIWLRGRSGEQYWASSVMFFYDSDSEFVRKVVVRALRQMGAWAELDSIVKLEKNQRIRTLAMIRSNRSYAQRLASFTSRISKTTLPHEPIPLYIAPDVELDHGWRLKPVSLIRMILERIHMLLHGQKQ